MNSAGGQFSSARDLAKVMQMFLDPSRENSLVSPLVMREWLRSMHAWSDEINEVGMPWEIIKLPDSYGRPQRWYEKCSSHLQMLLVGRSDQHAQLAYYPCLIPYSHSIPHPHLGSSLSTMEYMATCNTLSKRQSMCSGLCLKRY